MKRWLVRPSTRYTRELVDDHRAHTRPENKNTDGYEGRVPSTRDGINERRRAAARWLVMRHGAR